MWNLLQKVCLLQHVSRLHCGYYNGMFMSFRKWEDDLVADMAEWLASDLPLPPGSPGGMTEYRRTLCISFFYKFYLTVLMQLKQKVENLVQLNLFLFINISQNVQIYNFWKLRYQTMVEYFWRLRKYFEYIFFVSDGILWFLMHCQKL